MLKNPSGPKILPGLSATRQTEACQLHSHCHAMDNSGPALAHNQKWTKRVQIGVHGLKIGRIDVIFQCAFFFLSKKKMSYVPLLGPARAQNQKWTKRVQIGVLGLKIGRIGIIFQCASFLFSKKTKTTNATVFEMH